MLPNEVIFRASEKFTFSREFGFGPELGVHFVNSFQLKFESLFEGGFSKWCNLQVSMSTSILSNTAVCQSKTFYPPPPLPYNCNHEPRFSLVLENCVIS